MTKSVSLTFEPSRNLLERLVIAVMNWLDRQADVAARNGEVPYLGL